MSSSPLSAHFACPRCDKTPLKTSDDSYTCGACKTVFPVIAGVPALFADPGTALDDWRQRLNLELEKLKNDAERIDGELEQSTHSEKTRARLGHLAAAYRDQRTRLEELMKPLSLSSLQADYATYLALRTRLPSDQGLNTYYSNIHRDWVWGDAENAASADLVCAASEDRPGKLLVLGSGASRLAYDVHTRTSPTLTVALDFNPMLVLLAAGLAAGKTYELYEFPIAPKTARDVAVLQMLRAPGPVEDFFPVLGDALRPPFAAGSFDTVITPWLIDVIPENFSTLCERINVLLTGGGRWINFGSLAFSNPEQAGNYSLEETLEVVGDAGFGEPDVVESDIPYMCSPHSRHGRVESVVCFSAEKKEAVKPPARYTALPDWLVKGDEPVPASQAFQMQAMSTRIHAFIMSLIDGKRSIKTMAKLMEEQRLMHRNEAESAIRNFLIKMHDDSRRQSGF